MSDHASVADDALSVQQAAHLCGTTYRTVYRMVQRGELPAEKPNGKPYRLRRADVEAFIERSRVKPGELEHLHPPRVIRPRARPGDPPLD